MNIILTYKNQNSPSFIFYKNALKKMNKNKFVNIKFKKFTPKILEGKFDIFLFMSGTCDLNFKKKKNILYGIVDPRAANYDNFSIFDFIIANGLEEKFFFDNMQLPTFIYPVYPYVKCGVKKKKKKTILAYHGNKEHLINMFPRITKAIQMISHKYRIELKLIYNFKDKGPVSEINEKYLKCKVHHLQYYEGCLNKYLSDTDIGIVPQLKSINKKKVKKNLGNLISKQLFKKEYFFSLNFKETTNLGRHFVFAQLKIPVVTDYTISSSNFINNMKNGLLAYDTYDWYENLEYLIKNKNDSIKIGKQFYKDWKKYYSHKVLNKNLLYFFKNNR